MSGVSKLLDEELQKRARQELKSLGSKGEVATKLKAIIAVKDHGVSQVAKIFNITRATLTKWVKTFKESNSSALVAKKKNPRSSKVTNEQMQIIESWMTDNSSMTIRQLRQRIFEEFRVDLSISTAHRIMQRLAFSFITPRPRHYKQNPQLQVEFKKNLSKIVKDSPDKQFFFFDESRFGTHSKIGHGWFKKGSRTTIPVKLGVLRIFIYTQLLNLDLASHLAIYCPK